MIASMRTLTYNEWLLEGRVPATGERADHYATNPERTAGVALFREEQTTGIAVARPVGCTEIITREEWDAARKERKRASARKNAAGPTALVRVTDRGMFQVWVGRNKAVIEHLRKNHWRFDKNTHRWCAKLDADISVVVHALEKLGCTVTQEDADA